MNPVERAREETLAYLRDYHGETCKIDGCLNPKVAQHGPYGGLCEQHKQERQAARRPKPKVEVAAELVPPPLPAVELEEDDWHLAHARAAEADVRAIERWLQETIVLTELFDGDHMVTRALGGAAGLLRDRRNGLVDEARRLRAVIQDTAREAM